MITIIIAVAVVALGSAIIVISKRKQQAAIDAMLDSPTDNRVTEAYDDLGATMDRIWAKEQPHV